MHDVLYHNNISPAFFHIPYKRTTSKNGQDIGKVCFQVAATEGHRQLEITSDKSLACSHATSLEDENHKLKNRSQLLTNENDDSYLLRNEKRIDAMDVWHSFHSSKRNVLWYEHSLFIIISSLNITIIDDTIETGINDVMEWRIQTIMWQFGKSEIVCRFLFNGHPLRGMYVETNNHKIVANWI